MKDRTSTLLDSFLERLEPRHAGDTEFLQAAAEIARDVLTIEKASSAYTRARVLDRLCEADRIITFTITWHDDAGAIRINRGWRVQQTNLLGPYKGGLRWVAGLTPSVLKFLAFEQAFKNALTGLPLGAAKGGADFDPAAHSPTEITRFAQAFMRALAPHIGPDTDVPAGDIGVGAEELGVMIQTWRETAGRERAGRWGGGALTGKPEALGGSALRAEATGYGLVYFTAAMLGAQGTSLTDKRVAISGRGNVSGHAARKAMTEGARVITLSSRAGTWYAPDGLTTEALDWLLDAQGDAAFTPPRALKLDFLPDRKPWGLDCDIALPCATQNELDARDAKALADTDCRLLAEGANMPLTPEAATCLTRAGVLQAPGKAANAGGVAVSGLEMQQNASFTRWNPTKVDRQLRKIMAALHDRLLAERQGCCLPGGQPDYRRAANVAAYRRLADATVATGL
ncbi:MAG: Glu/Leu/Phe/Val dehydrogenase dimerization domain-containing protein [Roseinatronobacter sp.]